MTLKKNWVRGNNYEVGERTCSSAFEMVCFFTSTEERAAEAKSSAEHFVQGCKEKEIVIKNLKMDFSLMRHRSSRFCLKK